MSSPVFPSKKQILIALLVGIALAAVAAHVYIAGRQDVKGTLGVLDHIFDVTLALALTATLVSVGHAV